MHLFSFCKIHSALPLANPLWDATLDTMPGAFCLVNAGVNNIQQKDFIIYERLWDSLPASILLCGSSNVNTIYGQPRTSRPIIGMFCLLCAHRKKLLWSCREQPSMSLQYMGNIVFCSLISSMWNVKSNYQIIEIAIVLPINAFQIFKTLTTHLLVTGSKHSTERRNDEPS